MLRDSACKRLPLEATAMWTALPDERKWRRDAGEALLRARLLSLPDLDAHLAKAGQPAPSRAPADSPAICSHCRAVCTARC